MEEAITRAVQRQFPELAGNYHLPRFAVIQGVADAPAAAGICDSFRPRYAADLQVLDENGEPDSNIPVLAGVPLPVAIGGDEMGFFGFPSEGTTVVMGFAYGRPDKPFIQTVLPHGLSLPQVPKGDQVWQHSDAVQQRVDADGNWTRQTDAAIKDACSERQVQALLNQEGYQSHTQTVDEHSTESVGGIKTIEALGAMKLLSAGSASLAAVDDLHQATGRDLNLVVGQKHNAVIGGDMAERIKGLRKSIADQSQRYESPKTWIGSSGVNVLAVLADLIDLVAQMNTQLAAHTHVPGPTPSPTDAAAFSLKATNATLLGGKIKAITL
ncbi:hypothetical protein PS3A_40290 [Pseudomonas sp. 3A(2025)]